jgi:hypothetical protein
MSKFQHFTVDDAAFKGLVDYSNDYLHPNGMKLVPVV